jgi:hypothetical protein
MVCRRYAARLVPVVVFALAAGVVDRALAAPPAPTSAAPERVAGEPTPKHEDVLLGPLTRERIEETVPDWVKESNAAHPDSAATRELAAVEPGAEVIVYLGTWCSDSRREVSRLWRALDEAGAGGQDLPFSVRYVGIDEDKKRPEADVQVAGLRFLPTIIVRRGGREQGRIVESAPHGVETDLLTLLNGHASGLLTLNAQLLTSTHPSTPR